MNYTKWKWIPIGVVLIGAGIILILALVMKYTRKVYKKGSKVTEDDFLKNGPEIVRKSEGSVNDN